MMAHEAVATDVVELRSGGLYIAMRLNSVPGCEWAGTSQVGDERGSRGCDGVVV